MITTCVVWLTLTLSGGGTLVVPSNQIVAVASQSSLKTKVTVGESGQRAYVKETPEEILSLINNSCEETK